MDEAAQITAAEPQFTLSWEHERESVPVCLTAMLDANAEDAALCEWLRNAEKVGLEYRGGGGAGPLCVIRRVL